jgi:hypothetical protein
MIDLSHETISSIFFQKTRELSVPKRQTAARVSCLKVF